MSPTWLQIALLGLVQGAAELLPVSSSAHVIVVEKLLGLDPAAPAMTFLLVMLHTGTMAAVIVYFWKAWRESYFPNGARTKEVLGQVVLATGVTGGVGVVLIFLIEKLLALATGETKAEIESLFSCLPLIAVALAAAGIVILISGYRTRGKEEQGGEVALSSAGWIGAVQGICLPFRGFSRSGATISTGLLLGVGRRRAEEFSFALAVALTPLALGKELHRFLKTEKEAGVGWDDVPHLLLPGLAGACFAFLAGLLALKFLSRLLEGGRWHYFGWYCLVAAAGVAALASAGW